VVCSGVDLWNSVEPFIKNPRLTEQLIAYATGILAVFVAVATVAVAICNL